MFLADIRHEHGGARAWLISAPEWATLRLILP
jgi:hypothetical protein